MVASLTCLLFLRCVCVVKMQTTNVYRESPWRHQMETFSALLAICAGNSPVPGEFPTQRPVTRCFDVYFDLRLNKRLSKQSWGWWFERLPRPLWRHSNASHSTMFYMGIENDNTYSIKCSVTRRQNIWFDNATLTVKVKSSEHISITLYVRL